MKTALRAVLILVAWLALVSIALASTNYHVLLITIDGLAGFYLSDPQAPIPTLRKLASDGAAAEGLRVSNPSVTWPNHTTLVTGAHPDKHSVLVNGVVVRPGPGQPVRIDGLRDKSELVAVPTVFDFLHQAGYRTAAINWPCTRAATTLHDNFPDVRSQITNITPQLRSELISAAILDDATNPSFEQKSGAGRDQIWTASAAHVIKTRRPNLLLLHLLITDSIQHRHGPQTPAAYTALAVADGLVADVLRALTAAGIQERTTILVTSDHGFEPVSKLIKPNVLFRKAGLMRPSAGTRLQAISEGGTAFVYLTDPATIEADRAKALELLRDHEGIAEIIAPDQYGPLRLPDPARNPQVGDLVLVAKEGYAFSNEALDDEAITELSSVTGSHGYPSTNPKMNGVFIASGRGIKPAMKLGIVSNVDVAPTIAALLGQKFPAPDGKVLREILSEPARN